MKSDENPKSWRSLRDRIRALEWTLAQKEAENQRLRLELLKRQALLLNGTEPVEVPTAGGKRAEDADEQGTG